MDFITDMPLCEYQGMVYDFIFLLICQYIKMAQYIVARIDWTAEQLAQAFLEQVWQDKGLPDSIISDRGLLFTLKFLSALCFHFKIKQRLSTAFHAQTDGQTERQNETLKQYLRGYENYQQDDWIEWLVIAEFAYNNSVHSSTGETLFYLAYGFHPSMPDTSQFAFGINIPSAGEKVLGLINS